MTLPLYFNLRIVQYSFVYSSLIITHMINGVNYERNENAKQKSVEACRIK